jgi:urease accessory protein
MILVHHHIHAHLDPDKPVFAIPASRETLAKRRWRGVATDHTDFGFDLEHPLAHGDIIHQSASAAYRVEQLPEPVLEVILDPDPAAAALLAWKIGNLHFPAQISGCHLRVADDPAIRQMFEREAIAFLATTAVFQPVVHATPHSHYHA